MTVLPLQPAPRYPYLEVGNVEFVVRGQGRRFLVDEGPRVLWRRLARPGARRTPASTPPSCAESSLCSVQVSDPLGRGAALSLTQVPEVALSSTEHRPAHAQGARARAGVFNRTLRGQNLTPF